MIKTSINLLEYFLNNTDDSYYCIIHETRENIKALRKELEEAEKSMVPETNL
jgi:hypothetical protein